jgi:hypothetical protein
MPASQAQDARRHAGQAQLQKGRDAKKPEETPAERKNRERE